MPKSRFEGKPDCFGPKSFIHFALVGSDSKEAMRREERHTL